MNCKSKHRRSIRLKHYDYAQAGFYFVTICTQHRLCLFGKIKSGEMVLNDAGAIAEQCLLAIPDHYPNTKLHEYIVMPNHVHYIIEITVGANNYSPLHGNGTSRTLGAMVRGFKIGVTKWFREHTNVQKVWQRNYYEHIIRNEESYLQISEYVQTNPALWLDDKYYTEQEIT